MKLRTLRTPAALLPLTLALAIALPGAAVAAGPSITVVADGLHSPRGLAFGPGGILYVAQAGDATAAGSIIEIRNSMSQHPATRSVIAGLPSIGDEGEFVGVDGISVIGRGTNQSIYAITALSPQATGSDAFGNLLRIGRDGQVDAVANVGSADYEWAAANSGLWEEFPDANPYAVLAIPGHVYVVDAGANTLDEVMPDGSVAILAFFPNELIRDAVPTCVAQGPDGALYVGTLALVDSFAFGPSAKVYRVDPSQANLADPAATPMTVWASGLFPINGCAFGPDGSFYASQLFTNPSHDPAAIFGDPRGDVVRIPWGHPDTHEFLTGGALGITGGVAVGPNGVVYVADRSSFTAPGTGRVVRLGH
jgi:glucose/arabinose dehydrogenase